MFTSVWNIASFVFCFLALVCSWIAFTVPAWGWDADSDKRDARGYGPWKRCEQYYGGKCKNLFGFDLIWYQVFQACVTLGFVGVNLSFLLINLQMFVRKCKKDVEESHEIGTWKKNKEIAFWNAIQSFLTGMCYLAAIILFDKNFSELANTPNDITELGMCWELAIVALVSNGLFVVFFQVVEVFT